MYRGSTSAVQVWAEGQCTPLCTRCDREKGYCRFAVVHNRVLHLRVSESAMFMAKSIFWDRSFRADTIRAPSVSDPFGACTAFWALALIQTRLKFCVRSPEHQPVQDDHLF